jgi:hypothetical protein
MFWQALSERVTDQCAGQDNSEDDKTNDQRILIIGFPGWSAQEAGGSTLLAKSAAEATSFAVRPIAAAVNSTNE